MASTITPKETSSIAIIVLIMTSSCKGLVKAERKRRDCAKTGEKEGLKGVEKRKTRCRPFFL
jgi:hypothetical protein